MRSRVCGPLTLSEVKYPVLLLVHMDMLYPFSPVGLDLQLLRVKGCYPVSRFVFGKFGLIWDL